MRAQTIHRSQSRASVGSSDSDSNSLNRTQIPANAVPKEIDMYGKYLSGTIDEEQIESLSEGETDDSSEEDSEEISSSEDEDIALAREIMAGKSLLYRENDMNQIPNDLPPLRNSGEQKIKFGKIKNEQNIGSKIVEKRTKRIYDRCIDQLGDVNFKHAYRLLRRVYESGRAGDPNVMEELADLIGPELAKKCMIVEELIMAEEQTKS